MHIEKILINIFQMTLCLCTVCFMRGTIPFTHGHLRTVQLNDCAFVLNMHVRSVSCQFLDIVYVFYNLFTYRNKFIYLNTFRIKVAHGCSDNRGPTVPRDH